MIIKNEKYFSQFTREVLIQMLETIDPNGVYNDDASMREFDNVMSKDEAIDIITRLTNQ